MTTNVRPEIQRAMESVEQAAVRVESDPTRPVFHFRPPANWMNDPNGPIYHNGVFHLFYQHNPYGDEWGDIHWGHARSHDLVQWKHLPIALWPSTEMGEAHCYSGCARVNQRGEPMLFYTSVGSGEEGNRPDFEQWARAGDAEWLTWRKHPENPILSLETHGGPRFDGDWRDPFIFEEEGRTFMVLGSTVDDIAGVVLYESVDPGLAEWRYRKLLYQQPRSEVRFQECPNFFKVDGKWLLLTSPYRPVEYAMGSFDVANLTFSPESDGILDYGYNEHSSANYYATNVLYDADDTCILLGWVRGFPTGRGWNGCLALPRILSIDVDGRPVQTPLPALAQLRGEQVSVRDVGLEDEVYPHIGEIGDTLELKLTLKISSAERAGVRIGDGGNPIATIGMDGRTLYVDEIEVALGADFSDMELDVHLFLDKTVLEVFADDGRVCVTKVVDYVGANPSVSFFAENGRAQFDAIEVWELDSIW